MVQQPGAAAGAWLKCAYIPVANAAVHGMNCYLVSSSGCLRQQLQVLCKTIQLNTHAILAPYAPWLACVWWVHTCVRRTAERNIYKRVGTTAQDIHTWLQYMLAARRRPSNNPGTPCH